MSEVAFRPFRLIEVESWPECREVIVEGRVDLETIKEFWARLQLVVESDNECVLIDFDRCEFIDVVAVKQLVVVRQWLSDQRRELLIFGARGQVRGSLEDVGSFDCEPPPPRPTYPPVGPRPRTYRSPGPT